jgi:SAM-dependent methyltransferase
MLRKIRDKIQGTELEDRITLHKCEENKIGVSEHVDFVLLFYMVHEIPHVESFFCEIKTILRPDGQVFMVEPPFHVSRKAFENAIKKACDAGLSVAERPKLFLNKAAILKKGPPSENNEKKNRNIGKDITQR